MNPTAPVETSSTPWEAIVGGKSSLWMGVTVLKAFLIDLNFVNMPYRILTFAGLGVGLIIISWMYGRYGIGREPA